MFLKFTTSVLNGMKKFFTTERVVILIVFLILMAALVMYANGKTGVLDKMEDGTEEKEKKEEETDAAKPAADEEKKSSPSGYSVKEVATPKDLLPITRWACSQFDGDSGLTNRAKTQKCVSICNTPRPRSCAAACPLLE